MIKISIITVCFNSESYIEQTIKSVLSQSYNDIEYIIIDGGSTDGTIEIIRKYQERIAVFVSEPDENMYDAINKGMKFATGDYIAVLNSDDIYLSSDVISNVVSKLKRMPQKYKAIYGNLKKITANGQFIKTKRGFQVNFRTLLCSKKLTFVGHGTLFISKNACIDIGEYEYSKFKAAADYDYILRLFRKFRCQYVNIDIMGFRVHEISITSSGKIDEERKSVLSKNGYDEILCIEKLIRYYFSWGYFAMINIKSMGIDNLKSFLLYK
ncbi:glycosyltransferase [Bacteroides fragilis]|jgi:glycosyltransferase involved in cell wall biosynthesis|uniref:glycosyltransferase family 2 protein n=1 Tax=Bacteroides TaxID=816 RepID=UPI0018992702|nr:MULTISPECIES: glycosyltransferase family 2 protein [Bacteroides]MBY2897990.1 hypothetical protein [Bacteroides fragilis]MCE8615157.1 glycosyltransferase [Bacteroides fragilis]MCE8623442.1 glycosyltransferase [Bacteroides fragilis]MCE8700464.1 glycosyltransferase [Bacteroides fragilis]MCE8706718.1 glycosyltransferase [Bacteroides fragilis]